jgi:hypothetical protein
MTGIRLVPNWSAVEGDIKKSPDWDELQPLVKLDILKDWIGLLSTEYDSCMYEWRRELKKRKKKTVMPK